MMVMFLSPYDKSSLTLSSYDLQIDCSHGNSSKQHQKQVEVADDIVSPGFVPRVHTNRL